MKKIKCTKCGKTLLFIEYGKLKIKCARCGHVMKIKKPEGNEQRERQESS